MEGKEHARLLKRSEECTETRDTEALDEIGEIEEIGSKMMAGLIGVFVGHELSRRLILLFGWKQMLSSELVSEISGFQSEKR